MSTLRNIVTVARREYTVRIRTRSFVLGTLALVIGVAAIALVPVIVRYIDRASTQTLAVYVAEPNPGLDPVPALDALLNARPETTQPADTAARAFTVTRAADLAQARADVVRGATGAVISIERSPTGDLRFTLYTNDEGGGRTARLLQQACNAFAVTDRLARAGVRPTDQASLFAPAAFAVRWPDPARTDETKDSAQAGASYLLGFGMTILIFMMVVLYGNWVAMSVVEEKSSRVMEVVLNAATPFQLLTGKVLGVGAVALTQYVALLVTGIVALLAQGPVASLALGSTGGDTTLPAGLTMSVLVLFGIYGVLGFLLYAVLYAAAGSLASRTEDVNQAVMPMTLISTAGWMVAVYAATGLLDPRSGWLVVLSQVPFMSPFMMLSRLTAGEVSGAELVLSIVLLVTSIAGALWLAARIYAAGVLLYGQRPAVRAVVRIIRTGM